MMALHFTGQREELLGRCGDGRIMTRARFDERAKNRFHLQLLYAITSRFDTSAVATVCHHCRSPTAQIVDDAIEKSFYNIVYMDNIYILGQRVGVGVGCGEVFSYMLLSL